MDLISTENFVEAPFIIVKMGEYTFGSYTGKVENRVLGSAAKVTYPNCMKGLTVVKINGQVNTYTLQMTYAITENDDPNMLEKVFSSIKNSREMTLTYGDWNNPATIYKEETALITSIKSNVSMSSSKIDYTISGVSNALNLNAALYDFPERNAKPSDVIKELLYSSNYGMQTVFTGMINKKDVNNNNIIASDDKVVTIPAKSSTSVLDYTSYLVEHMSSTCNKDGDMVKGSIYQMCIMDDTTNQFGGPYFKVKKIDTTVERSTDSTAWEIDVGYPGKNFVTNFEIDNDESWSILYDYQDSIAQSSYTYRIDNEGNMIVEDSPSLMRSRRNKVVKERNKTWWTQMTQFPITARLTIKGLVRPTLIMDYLKLNVLFYGNKHISSGIYVITKQEDKIDASGYRTTLTLLRVKEDT
jgi:hypothetical protein